MIGTVTDFEPSDQAHHLIGFARVGVHLTKWIDSQNRWLAGFLRISDTSAAAIREYLLEGGAWSESRQRKWYNPRALFKPINMDMPIPDEVPGDLQLAGDINRIESVLSRMH
jgi:hypothetical protein